MEEYSMTALEASRLIDWLKANGMTDSDATACIQYIATGIAPGGTAPASTRTPPKKE